jgi:hypothetical protein
MIDRKSAVRLLVGAIAAAAAALLTACGSSSESGLPGPAAGAMSSHPGAVAPAHPGA